MLCDALRTALTWISLYGCQILFTPSCSGHCNIKSDFFKSKQKNRNVKAYDHLVGRSTILKSTRAIYGTLLSLSFFVRTEQNYMQLWKALSIISTPPKTPNLLILRNVALRKNIPLSLYIAPQDLLSDCCQWTLCPALAGGQHSHSSCGEILWSWGISDVCLKIVALS